METINIQFQVPSTGQYTLDEFVAKLKDYAEKLASSISKSENSYQERYMSQAEQEAYVAEVTLSPNVYQAFTTLPSLSVVCQKRMV